MVIGRTARYVSEADALDHVAGYCVINDVSERAFQLERGGTWDKGKGCDSFGPIGPWLVTRDEAGDIDDLAMWLEVNDHRYQDGSTSTMVFKPAQLVSYVSRFMSLQPGDVISTGTPPGVGMGQKPPVYLQPGDRVALGIQGLGRFTEQGSALLIMGIAGGAIVPQLFVILKESMDFQLVFLLLMVPCYLYILYFALRGHRAGRG